MTDQVTMINEQRLLEAGLSRRSSAPPPTRMRIAGARVTVQGTRTRSTRV